MNTQGIKIPVLHSTTEWEFLAERVQNRTVDIEKNVKGHLVGKKWNH